MSIRETICINNHSIVIYPADSIIPEGRLRIWTGWDARRKFWIKPLKETDLGVVQAFFDP